MFYLTVEYDSFMQALHELASNAYGRRGLLVAARITVAYSVLGGETPLLRNNRYNEVLGLTTIASQWFVEISRPLLSEAVHFFNLHCPLILRYTIIYYNLQFRGFVMQEIQDYELRLHRLEQD